ncbi:MAG TPA: ATP-binding protein [Rhodothermales bacterium]|nr:ATP-binding protein [Rhodothermales bacterium]
MKRFVVIAALLASLVPSTWLLQQITVERLERDVTDVQKAFSVRSAQQIEEDFESIRGDMRRQAVAVASDDDALYLLNQDFEDAPALATIAAIRTFRGLHDLGPSSSAELFDTDGRLVVWSGFSVLPPPRVWPPGADGWVVVESDDYRKCLVIWYPVGPRGFVRIARVVQSTQEGVDPSPRDDLAVRWSHLTGRGVEVVFDDSTVAPATSGASVVNVSLNNGVEVTLGLAAVSIPSPAVLVREEKRKFGDLQAVWFGLAMGWIFAGLWVALNRWWLRAPLDLGRTATAAAGRLALLAALRFGFLSVNFPGRWFRSEQVAGLFDPVNLASSVAGGVARSAGDLLLTGVFGIAASVAVLGVVSRYLAGSKNKEDSDRGVWLTPAASLIVTGVVFWHALLTRRAMLDATLDFFAWTGLAPEPLVLVVFCALLLSTIATVLLAGSAAALAQPAWGASLRRWPIAAAALLPPIAAFILFGQHALIPAWLFGGYAVVAVAVGGLIAGGRLVRARALRLRPIVASILIAATLLYPLVYLGMDAHRRLRVVDVAEEFVERSDDHAVSNASALLEQMASSREVDEMLKRSDAMIRADSWLQFAHSLPAVDVVPGIVSARILLYDVTGQPIGGYEASGSGVVRVIPSGLGAERLRASDRTPALSFEVLRDGRSRESTGYAGVAPARDSLGEIRGWLAARFERHRISTPFGALFGYSDWRRSLSLAEFQDGVRVRSEGEDFERYTLPTDVVAQLENRDEIWRNESVYGRAFLTYYVRVGSEFESGSLERSSPVVAVRAQAVIPYDHLYYLLRIALSGLWFGVPVYIVGLVMRWRRGELPAKRTQIGDRVLDAFMLVGTLVVLVMGLVGQQVITRENEGAIRSRLERRLERVEDELRRTAADSEPLFAVQQRLPIDSLARELSLDLNVYRGPWLSEHSQMGPDVLPLMGYRLPPEAYDDLFLKRFRQSFVESTGQYGFVYTIGYKALMDSAGFPVSVVAVLTAPEQERIREERARTTAYFFGALLILLLIIMGTATVLASALAGPITRLRDGLRTVAEGRFQKPIPVESRDEVGELVESFNQMQSQLAESRRRLAQQERELAWREMARQVAHEIKNPLTPMKLSIQHLQRAFEEGGGSRDGEFESAFRRITKTISEQIETLVNIANEFSTFARMPKRHLEQLDVNGIIREAVALLQEESASKVAFSSDVEPAIVEADRDELRRVFINLIKNGQQATESGGTVRVTLRAETGLHGRPDQPVVVVEIVDTGSGILEDVRDKIFQPNFSTKTSGMGLGLAIAKKSIEDVKGEIGFATETEKGSTFWVRLPLVA